jgi:N-acyl-D-aspartate/D-glutamate deacylase
MTCVVGGIFVYDILIRQGQVITGAANPWFRSDIGIQDGHITTIGCIQDEKADLLMSIVTPISLSHYYPVPKAR